MFMPPSIRVLIVEDRPADAELIIRELRQAGFEPDWQRVETEEDYLAQLASRPDIILADHNLPQFSAPRALALLQERGLDIPFVIITGSISEEVAVERMKQGATDYLLKDRLTRLGQAVEHALEEKLLREEKRAAQETLLQLATIVESSDDAIIGTKLDGTIFSWNSAAERLYGYSANEVMGQHVAFVAPPDRMDEPMQIMERLKQGERVPHFETVRVCKNGQKVHVSLSISPIKDVDGTIIGTSAIARDLTRQKRSEEALNKIYVKEIQHRQSKTVRDLGAIFVLSILVLLAAHYFDVFEKVSAWVLKYRETAVDELITTFVFLAFAFAFFSYRRWMEVKAEIFGRQQIEAALHTLRGELELRVQERTADLAGSNELLRTEVAQRKQVEKEILLLQSITQAVSEAHDFHAALEVTLRKVCEATGWAYGEAWIPKADGTGLECAPVWYGGMEGLEKFREGSKEFTFSAGAGLPGRVYLSKQPVWVGDVTVDANFLRASIAREAGLTSAMGIPILAGDEVVAVINFFLFAQREEDKRLIKVVSAVAAQLGLVFQRKRAEKERARLISVIEAATDLVGIADPQGHLLYLNKNGRKLLGIGEDEDISSFQVSDSHPEPARKLVFEEAIPTAIREGVWRGENSLLTRDGREIPVLQVILAHRAPDGSVEFLSTIIRDITERKRAEEALQARHQELQALHEIGQNVLQSQDLKSLLEGILDRLFTIGAFDLGMIRLLDSSNEMLKPVVSRGYRNPGELKSHSIRPEDPTAGKFQIDAFAGFRVNVTENVPATPGLRTLKREGVRAAILIPLRAENQALGTILLASRAPRKFKAEEIHLLEAIGNQVGVAIQKAQLQEETQQNLERIRALHEIDIAITSTLNLRATLDILLEKTDRLLPFVAATTVRLLNRETGELEPVACRNIDEKEWKAATAGMSVKGLDRMLPEKSAPVMTLNVQTDPRSLAPDFLRKCGLVSSLRVPLVVKDEVLGALTFFTKEEHQFTDEEVEFLTTLAGQASIAINNAQLYEEIKSSKSDLELINRRLDKSLREVSSFYSALAPLAPAESVNKLMEGVIARLMIATGADAALIRLRDDAKGTLALASQRGFPDYYLKSVDAVAPEGAADWVFKSGEPIISPNIAAEARFKGKIQLKVGLRSCAMLPLKVENRVRGIVHLASRDLGFFDESQRDHLMTIARQMSIMLENREFFEHLKTSRDELEKSNRVKDEFLSVMSHELRTPLNVVVGYTGMIMDGLLGEVNDKQKEAMEKVIRRTNDQLALVNNILYATVLESETVVVDTQDFNLEDFLNQLKLDYQAPINKELSLNWDYPFSLPIIRTDSGKLKHILRNLVDNAIKFTGKGSVTVSARVIKEAISDQPSAISHQQSAIRNSESAISQVEFKVADTGVGIPPDALLFVFDKFRQMDSSETRLYGGVGMGLYIVKKFTELMGGTVEVESKVGKGTTLTVRIPVEK